MPFKFSFDRRIIWLVIFVSLLLTAGTSCLLYWGSEPGYGGRTLTEWLRDYNYLEGRDVSFPSVAATNRMSTEAVIAIGTNAVPTLLKWLQAKPRPLAEKMDGVLTKVFHGKAHVLTAQERKANAFKGFLILKRNGQIAIAPLIELTKNSDATLRFDALSCLWLIEPDKEILQPVLARCAEDPDLRLRQFANSLISTLKFYEEK